VELKNLTSASLCIPRLLLQILSRVDPSIPLAPTGLLAPSLDNLKEFKRRVNNHSATYQLLLKFDSLAMLDKVDPRQQKILV
jgi:hypothetical protein